MEFTEKLIKQFLKGLPTVTESSLTAEVCVLDWPLPFDYLSKYAGEGMLPEHGPSDVGVSASRTSPEMPLEDSSPQEGEQ